MIGPTSHEIANGLAAKAIEVCQKLLPNGREHQGTWLAGDTQGNPGKSLNVRLDGPQAGLWIDFSTDESGNLLTLWSRVRGMSMKDAAIEAAEYLGTPLQDDSPTKSQTWATLQREMGHGTGHDLTALADLRKLPTEDGLSLAVEHRILFFGPVTDQEFAHHSWIITDDARLSAQARRMDGKPWESNGQKAKTIHGTTAKWPVGCANSAKLDIALTEGGPDLLAAYTAIAILGLHDSIQPATVLGSSQSIDPRALPHFANKTVWLFPHDDANLAGLQGASRWSKRLAREGCTVIPFDFRPYGVKDLNDFVSAVGASKQLTPTQTWED